LKEGKAYEKREKYERKKEKERGWRRSNKKIK
jgi:hypothetical protein